MQAAVKKEPLHERFAQYLADMASAISSKHKFRRVEKGRYSTVERLERLVDEINGVIYQVPKGYSLHVDWTTTPTKLCIKCMNNTGHTEVVYPPMAVQRMDRARKTVQESKGMKDALR